ncbi:hypothetical protein F4808DRAFT_145376 [Astrocystis sublimbata]|nr:hypothetical protein F4808DRAFT_145376 [Astrocystis sublimbata]
MTANENTDSPPDLSALSWLATSSWFLQVTFIPFPFNFYFTPSTAKSDLSSTCTHPRHLPLLLCTACTSLRNHLRPHSRFICCLLNPPIWLNAFQYRSPSVPATKSQESKSMTRLRSPSGGGRQNTAIACSCCLELPYPLRTVVDRRRITAYGSDWPSFDAQVKSRLDGRVSGRVLDPLEHR